MFGILNYKLFILSAVMLNITPGSDTIYIVGRSIAGGRKAGVVSALGINTGAMIHTLLAALGLSLLLARSAAAFHTVKFLGAGYLIFLGIKTFRSKDSILTNPSAKEEKSLPSTYVQGILTNVLNPKVALFYLAFLPQFIIPENPYGPLPFLLLGTTFLISSTLWCILLAILSSTLGKWIAAKGKIGSYLNRISGVIFICLGLNLLRAKADS